MKWTSLLPLLLVSSLATASDIDTILGLKLNQPLNLPACKLAGNGMYEKYPDVTCVQPPQGLSGYTQKIRRVFLSLDDGPDWLFLNRIFAFEKDNILVGVMFVTDGYKSQDQLSQGLQSKFGSEPVSVKPYHLRNKYGVEYLLEQKIWVDSNGDISAIYIPDVKPDEEAQSPLDFADVHYETKAGLEYRMSIKVKSKSAQAL
jgi:hypothetical protein